MKILMVLTSHDQLGNTGEKAGFWLEELAAPYYVFKDAGADIPLASPKGGQPPPDPKSSQSAFQTDATRRFEADPRAKAALGDTRKLSEASQEGFDGRCHVGRLSTQQISWHVRLTRQRRLHATSAWPMP